MPDHATSPRPPALCGFQLLNEPRWDIPSAFLQAYYPRAYDAAQLLTFERHRGWFFWSYRTETTPEWCFRECVERCWLPPCFQ
jgi:aryl-phospho-beta-D-glucosidase BglC (GH1 family)